MNLPQDAGLLLAAEHVLTLAVVAGFLFVCVVVGRRALSLAGADFDRPLEDLLFSAATGIGLVGTAMLCLGALGLYRPAALGTAFVLLIVIGAPEAGRLYDRARKAARFENDRFGRICFSVFVLFMLGVLVLSLSPPIDWDALMYHLEVPRRFIETGGIHVPEDNLHVTRTGLANLVYVPLLMAGGAETPAAFSASTAILMGLAVYEFGARFLDRQTAGLTIAGLWGTTTILLVAATPRVEVTLAFLLFMAHYALFLALRSSASRICYLAAALIGFAVGVKFHALAYAVGLAPMVLWIAWRRGGAPVPAIRSALTFFVLTVAVAAPWLIKNWILVGPPLYPLFSEPILPPWLGALYGTREIPPSVSPEAFGWIWELRRPFNLPDAFFSPGHLTIEVEGRLYFLNPVLLLLPLWAFHAREKTLTWLVVPAVLYLVVLLAPFPRTNLRYLIPAIPPLTLVAFDILRRLVDRIPRPTVKPPALAVAMLLALAPSGLTIGALLFITKAPLHVVGRVSDTDYLLRHFTYGTAMEAVSRVNALSDGSRTLLIFEARGFHFSGDVLQDNDQTNWALLRSLLGRRCLDGTGITHVLTNIGALEYWILGGLDPALADWPDFLRFADECLEEVWRNEGFVLFQERAEKT